VFLIQTPAWGVESWFAGPVPVEGKGFGGWLVQSPSWREDIVVQGLALRAWNDEGFEGSGSGRPPTPSPSSGVLGFLDLVEVLLGS